MYPIFRHNLFRFAATSCLLAIIIVASATGQSMRAVPKERRLIVNCDGSVVHCWARTIVKPNENPVTREQFVDLVFSPIEDANVDAVFFSFGSGNVAEYQSNVLEWPGEADGFKFPESRTWHGGIDVDPSDQYRNPHALASAGHNPPGVIVAECHRRGMDAFVSLRMNDTHDGQHPKGERPNPELPSFKRQNPDWLVENLDRWSALDFSKPQVRALKQQVIEEFFERWDFDGVELDWLRHTLNFPRGTERENAEHLTNLLRRLRKSLDRRAVDRGRPIEIAVRVPEKLEWCLLGGYDVPTWIEEDLIDLLILGQGLHDLPNIEEFRSLMKSRRLPIYPSIVPFGNGYRVSPDEVLCGTAANLWQCGADGIYAFNWMNYGKWRTSLLGELAEPETLRVRPKHFLTVHRFDAGPSVGTDYLRFNTPYRSAQVPLDLNVADGEQRLRLFVSESGAEAELWIATRYGQAGDEVEVVLNGAQLKRASPMTQRVGYQLDFEPGNGVIGLPPMDTLKMHFAAHVWRVPEGVLRAGDNTVSLRLKVRGPGSDKSLQIRRVELQVR